MDEARSRGVEILNLGIGDPDLPTPEFIVERLCWEARRQENHQYPSYRGLKAFREAVTQWYARRFGVTFDPGGEVVSLIGSKEGIAHFPLCVINPGDLVLASDPGYPVYKIGTMLAGGNSVALPLLRKNAFLPDFSMFPESILERTRLIFLNYPNNPTAAVASIDFFREVIARAKTYDWIVAHDLAYSEVSYDGYRAPSIFQVEGARDVAIEFHSLSKTFNMAGWRIGFAIGNARLVEVLGRIKTNIDSGIFNAVQWAGAEALSRVDEVLEANLPIYTRRRNLVVNTFQEMGFELELPKASFYIWIPVPGGYDSRSFTSYLLERSGVVVAPGVGFGKYGEGYVRISLTSRDEVLVQAMERIRTGLRGG